MKIDLDAARAARREANAEVPVLVLNGQEHALPAELPFEVAELLSGLDPESVKTDPAAAADRVGRILEAMLGDAHEAFLASKPSIDDILALVDGLAEAYGLEDLGESQASPAS